LFRLSRFGFYFFRLPLYKSTPPQNGTLPNYQTQRERQNDWAKETSNPRYILDLLLSVISVNLQMVEIVKNLPEVKFESEEENS